MFLSHSPPSTSECTSWDSRRHGDVIRVAGAVVDAEFRAGDLPGILNALEIERDGQPPFVAEVEERVGTHTVPAMARERTTGLRRGLLVRDTGPPMRVPVGRLAVCRVFGCWVRCQTRMRLSSGSLARSHSPGAKLLGEQVP